MPLPDILVLASFYSILMRLHKTMNVSRLHLSDVIMLRDLALDTSLLLLYKGYIESCRCKTTGKPSVRRTAFSKHNHNFVIAKSLC